ncbi:nucleotide exchange factor GrpE [Buchnera aphidicola (Hyperomyzus lactucae)]|uniref:Protein GrpE n=1 Tax=Buchnera aphidicola (Hyperomyzus lactucae) TaxID=1241860 RepID=A0A4D6Y4P7_9GAMM|nr:nucleotide exchange factor GrpE [Buchnera aphidicola]QCI20921.1 nucleotide exchange factor GrpE [Buchnera aphidicola (Hyperomyzus lactucae)]
MNNQENQMCDKNFSKKNNIEEKSENINDLITVQNNKIEDLKLQLLRNQKRIHDIELRKLANIENIKKNTEEKIKTIKNIEVENFLKKTIPIIDSLEDILTSSNELNIKDQPLIQGIELTLQSLLNILFKLGVKIEGKKNQIFNPETHTPIFTESSEKTSPNHIISVIKKGFTFNKILLRKAIVTIPKE